MATNNRQMSRTVDEWQEQGAVLTAHEGTSLQGLSVIHHGNLQRGRDKGGRPLVSRASLASQDRSIATPAEGLVFLARLHGALNLGIPGPIHRARRCSTRRCGPRHFHSLGARRSGCDCRLRSSSCGNLTILVVVPAAGSLVHWPQHRGTEVQDPSSSPCPQS